MTRRVYWGLAFLIILLLGVSAVLLMRDTDTEPKIVYIEVEPSKDNPPPVEPGYKWVWHHNHWDKVKIAEVAAERVPSPIAIPEKTNTASKPTPQKVYEGPLTYHEELLETNPVEALRLQTEERGHWSAAYIPDFHPTDKEALKMAWVMYVLKHVEVTGENPQKLDLDGISKEYSQILNSLKDRIRAGEDTSSPHDRIDDLTKLTWIYLDTPKSAGIDIPQNR